MSSQVVAFYLAEMGQDIRQMTLNDVAMISK